MSALSQIINDVEELGDLIPSHKDAVDRFVALVPALETAVADVQALIQSLEPAAAAVKPVEPVHSISVPEPAADKPEPVSVSDPVVSPDVSTTAPVESPLAQLQAEVAAPLPPAA